MSDDRVVGGISVTVVMPSGHAHTLSHVTDYDGDQRWDCGTVRITVKDGHLVTVVAPLPHEVWLATDAAPSPTIAPYRQADPVTDDGAVDEAERVWSQKLPDGAPKG